jgi:ribosomal protein S18 acetylase RimI-like enzyme
MNKKAILIYEGEINGFPIQAEGENNIYPENGKYYSEGYLKFDKIPSNFSPIYSKTWRCAHHPNIILNHPYEYFIQISFEGKAQGYIKRISNKLDFKDHSHIETYIEGNFSKRNIGDFHKLEIEQDLFFPFDEKTIIVSGYKKLIDSFNDEVIQLSYATITTNNTLSKPVILKYIPIYVEFQDNVYKEKFEISLQEYNYQINKINKDEYNKVEEILNNYNAYLQSIKKHQIPTIDLNKVNNIIGIKENEDLASIAIFDIDKDDDLLKGEYLNIYGIYTKPEYESQNHELSLLMYLINFAKQNNIKNIRSVVYPFEQKLENLFTTLSFRYIAKRFELKIK